MHCRHLMLVSRLRQPAVSWKMPSAVRPPPPPPPPGEEESSDMLTFREIGYVFGWVEIFLFDWIKWTIGNGPRIVWSTNKCACFPQSDTSILKLSILRKFVFMSLLQAWLSQKIPNKFNLLTSSLLSRLLRMSSSVGPLTSSYTAVPSLPHMAPSSCPAESLTLHGLRPVLNLKFVELTRHGGFK